MTATTSLCDTLYHLHSILTKRSVLDSITIVQVDEPLVLECGHLGINSHTFRSLCPYAAERFDSLERCPENNTHLDMLSAVLILLNPDDARFWVYRRRKIKSVTMDTEQLRAELWLAGHPVKLKPKSGEPFQHCRWLLQQFPHLVTSAIVDTQLQMCLRASSEYAHNYYSWNYRLWLFRNVGSLIDYEHELKWSAGWIKMHVSEFSGMNYRFNLLISPAYNYMAAQSDSSGSLKLPENQDSSTRKKLGQAIVSEIIWICDLVRFYPNHEALWGYLKMLFLFCNTHKYEYVKRCKPQISAVQKIKNKHSDMFWDTVIIGNLFGIGL